MMEIVYNGEMDKRACKEVLGRVIPALVKENPDIVYLDADLMSCIGTLKGTRDVADRAINCGIAEANMIGVACGLASAGFKPIVHTFGPFASRRCFDQVFLSAGYAKNDITIIGTDPGVMAAMNGGTHMPFEDMALYNTIPGATVIDVTDPTLLESAISGEGVEISVLDMFSVKPLDEEAVVSYAKKTGAVVVAENHNRHGGLYGSIAEVLVEKCPVPAACVAVEDEFGEVGPQSYLQERFGLTAEHIVSQVRAVLARKG